MILDDDIKLSLGKCFENFKVLYKCKLSLLLLGLLFLVPKVQSTAEM